MFVHLFNASSELFHNSFLIIALCKALLGTNWIISQICLLYTHVIKSEVRYKLYILLSTQVAMFSELPHL